MFKVLVALAKTGAQWTVPKAALCALGSLRVAIRLAFAERGVRTGAVEVYKVGIRADPHGGKRLLLPNDRHIDCHSCGWQLRMSLEGLWPVEFAMRSWVADGSMAVRSIALLGQLAGG